MDEDINLTDFVYTGNSHTESGYFAPGTSAYIDVILDGSGSDVAFDYNISVDTSALVDHPKIVFTMTNMGTNTVIPTNEATGTIYVTGTRTVTLRINLVWQNITAYDEADAELIDNPITFPMSVTCNQLLEE